MNLDYLGIVFRWMHILAACVAVGAPLFMRFGLLPSLDALGDEARSNLHDRIRQHWGRFVHLAISFLLVSGIYNIIHQERTYDLARVPYYRPLFAVKFLLALVVFFLATALVGRGDLTAKFRQNRRRWLTIYAVLVVLIVLISGVLRKADPPEKPRLSLVAPRSTASADSGSFLLPPATASISLS